MGLGLDEALMCSCAAGEIQHGFSVYISCTFFVGKYELMSSKLGKGLAGSKRCSLCFSSFSVFFQVCEHYYLSYISKVMSNLINSSKHWYHTARKS